MNSNLIESDLDFILIELAGIIDNFRGKRILVTGGTGFFGKWLIKAFVRANSVLNLNVSLTVLSRSPKTFTNEFPEFRNLDILTFIEGNILNFNIKPSKFDFIIHAAADSDAISYKLEPVLMFDTILNGTRRVLDFALEAMCNKVLFISSGAIYGVQTTDISNIDENYRGGPDPVHPSSIYSEAKRSSELFCKLYSDKYGLDIKIARCFAFVGPYLPLNKHFAIGNFIQNALRKENIIIKGDGTPLRSYMYTSDLIIWLLTIMVNGKSCHPYNVGSENAISILKLAEMVAQLSNEKIKIDVLNKPKHDNKPEQYVPSTRRAQVELNLNEKIPLENAILKTFKFYKSQLTSV